MSRGELDFGLKKSPHKKLTREPFFDCRVIQQQTTTIQFNSQNSQNSILMGVGPSSESHKAQYNVAVLGAAGGIGQTLSLLMKQSKFIKSLRLCEFSSIADIYFDGVVLSNECIKRFHSMMIQFSA